MKRCPCRSRNFDRTCWPCREPMLEPSAPEGLQSVGITHTGAVSYRVGGTPRWNREKAWEGIGGRGKALPTEHTPHSPSACASHGEKVGDSGVKFSLRRGRVRGKCILFLFIPHFSSLWLISEKLNQFSPWLCFSCDDNWWVLFLSWPMSFSLLFSPCLDEEREWESTLVDSWQPVKVNPPYIFTQVYLLSTSIKGEGLLMQNLCSSWV